MNGSFEDFQILSCRICKVNSDKNIKRKEMKNNHLSLDNKYTFRHLQHVLHI